MSKNAQELKPEDTGESADQFARMAEEGQAGFLREFL